MGQVENQAARIAELLLESRYTVALTGAGISTESGIPDFRSPGSGLWTMVDPEIFTLQGFKADPSRFYRTGKEFFYLLAVAEPNEAHRALGALEQRGLIKAVITQNVDGLHQKGGSSRVLEIHGSLRSASCIFCGLQVTMEQVVEDVEAGILPPLCPECGEPVKPDVVLFGEALPAAYREALEEARKADLILLVGSSMQVSPANLLPAQAGRLAVVNRTPTYYDSRADAVLHENATAAFLRIMHELSLRI